MNAVKDILGLAIGIAPIAWAAWCLRKIWRERRAADQRAIEQLLDEQH